MRYAVLAAMAGFAFALYGWGYAFRRLFKMERGIWLVTVVLGMASVVFLGGLLNAVALAYRPALLAMFLAGAGWAVYDLKEHVRNLSWPPSRAWFAVMIPAAVLVGYAVATQLPPAAFNTDDDFTKYFYYPVRMLNAGTVYSGPLSAMGSETLGGEAFLQGFIVAVFPIQYINVVDAVFGLFLCMALAGWFPSEKQPVAAALCALGAAFINPQYVNVSALYLAAALMMAAVALCAHPREQHGLVPQTAALGLIYAALFSMKPSFLLFIVLHAGFTAAVLAWRDRRQALRWCAAVAGFGVLGLLPWILTNVPSYWTAITSPVDLTMSPTPAAETLKFFSLKPNIFEATIPEYLAAMLAALAGAALAVRFAREERLSAVMAAATAVLCIACFIVMVVVMGPRLAGYDSALRYFAPFAIAMAPAVLGLVLLHAPRWNASVLVKSGLPLVLAIVPIAAAVPTFAPRAEQAYESGSILASRISAVKRHYINDNKFVLYGPMKEELAAEQAQVPAGETIVAWISTPFYLDFDRNPIIELDGAGLLTPWAELPSSGYVIWEYASFPTLEREEDIIKFGEHDWRIVARKIVFAKRLAEIAKSGGLVYSDNRYLIVRLDSTPYSGTASGQF
jgi:hypothetical protein